ncbi:MAG: hypothetical protein RIM72_12070 [Alphaproteobacteria bacterium]
MPAAVGYGSSVSAQAITLTAAQRQSVQNLQKVEAQTQEVTQTLATGRNSSGLGSSVDLLV